MNTYTATYTRLTETPVEMRAAYADGAVNFGQARVWLEQITKLDAFEAARLEREATAQANLAAWRDRAKAAARRCCGCN